MRVYEPVRTLYEIYALLLRISKKSNDAPGLLYVAYLESFSPKGEQEVGRAHKHFSDMTSQYGSMVRIPKVA